MNGKTRLGLGDAAVVAGVSRTTLLRAIRSGEISATRHKNAFVIDASELARAFPQTRPDAVQDTPRRDLAREADVTAEPGELRELRARLEAAEMRFADAHDQISDLRRRFDIATQQLGEALQQVRLLTDQRAAPAPIRRWWRFGR